MTDNGTNKRDLSALSKEELFQIMRDSMRAYSAAQGELRQREQEVLRAAYGHELKLVDDLYKGTTGTGWLGEEAHIVWCFYCGERPGWQKEHKQPLSRGGSNDAANIVQACHTCNSRKGRMTFEEYRASLERRTGQPHTFFGERKA